VKVHEICENFLVSVLSPTSSVLTFRKQNISEIAVVFLAQVREGRLTLLKRPGVYFSLPSPEDAKVFKCDIFWFLESRQLGKFQHLSDSDCYTPPAETIRNVVRFEFSRR
jgi:hypothetical protein